MMTGLDWAMLPLQQYANFSGRAPRAEYWWFALLYLAISLFALAADLSLGFVETKQTITVGLIVSIALFLPSLAVSVRRFHDLNMSGWYVLMPLVPVLIIIGMFLTPVGWVMLLVGGSAFTGAVMALVFLVTFLKYLGYMVSEGNRGPNLYGPSPYGYQYGR